MRKLYTLFFLSFLVFSAVKAQNVGIGTSNPAYKLDVVGDINFSGKLRVNGAATASKVLKTDSEGNPYWGDDNNTTYSAGTGISIASGTVTNTLPSKWTQSGSNLYPNSTSWNVGIGNSSPAYRLDVTGDSRATGNVYSGTHFISQSADPYFKTDGDSKHIVLSGGSGWASTGATMVLREASASSNTHGIEMYTGNAERVRLLSNGNVGIGTSSPGYKLDVAGDIRSTSHHIINHINPTIYFQDSDERSAMIHVNGNLMYFLNGSGVNSLGWSANGSRWPFIINMNNDELYFGGAAYFLEGNVGIGTSSPAQALDVVGAINFSNSVKFSGVNVIHGSSGDVYANVRVIRNESTSGGDGMYIGYGNTGGGNGHLRFYADGTTERMVIHASDGSVKVNNLAGTGTRPVYATANGTLTTGPTVSQWQLVDFTDFEGGNANSWSGTNMSITSGTGLGSFMYRNANVTTTLVKSFDLSNYPHTQVKVLFKFWFIDSWDGSGTIGSGDYGFAQYSTNGSSYTDAWRKYGNTNNNPSNAFAFNSTYYDQFWNERMIFNHSDNTLYIRFGSPFMDNTETWGVDDIEVFVR